MTHPASVPGGSDDPGVRAVAAQALELIADGARVGLGSGRAVSVFIAKLGTRAREGLRVSVGWWIPGSFSERQTGSSSVIPMGA
jgi:ribose 5-phosphate isomerase